MPAQGGEAVQVTHKGALAALESADGKFVYYTKSDEGTEGLWKAAVGGRRGNPGPRLGRSESGLRGGG